MAVSWIDSVYCLCPGIVTSSNGIDWVAHKDVSSFPVYAGVIGGSLSIAIAGDYTGCCFAGHLYSSRDGRQWTHQELGPTAWFTDAAYGGGVFVLGGGATASGVGGLLTSRTGLSWDRIPFPSRSGGYEYIQDISYSRGRFIILSGNFNYSHVYTSSDGSSWDYVATSNLGGFTGLALCDDIYLAVGPKGLFSSYNLQTWTDEFRSNGRTFLDLAYGDGIAVAVGDGPRILRSVRDTAPKLRIFSEGGGNVIRRPESTNDTAGLAIELTAVPDRWHRFLRWGDGTDDNPRTVVLSSSNESNLFTAYFGPETELETLAFGGTTRLAPVGMPWILVDGKLAETNRIVRTNSAQIEIGSSISNAMIFHVRNGSQLSVDAPIYREPFRWCQPCFFR
jgi:hypothetical protein